MLMPACEGPDLLPSSLTRRIPSQVWRQAMAPRMLWRARRPCAGPGGASFTRLPTNCFSSPITAIRFDEQRAGKPPGWEELI